MYKTKKGISLNKWTNPLSNLKHEQQMLNTLTNKNVLWFTITKN